MANEIVITPPKDERDLELQYNYYNQLPNDIKIRSDGIAKAATGKSNIELYEEYKKKFINDSIELVDIVEEKCKDLNTAKKFVKDVQKIADKYDANFFMVTDGASGYSNGNEVSNPAVKNTRNSQVEWEKNNGFDPDDDWGKKHISESDVTNLNLIVRALTELDHEQVAKLDGKWKNTVGDLLLDKTIYKKYRTLVFGVFSSGKLIGYCVLNGRTAWCPPEVKALKEFNKDTFMLCDVYVLPEYRGKGIATKMITESIRKHPDIQAGRNHIFLIVQDKKLYDVYKPSGFKVIDPYIMIKENSFTPQSELVYSESSDVINENFVFNKDDVYVNVEKFESGKSNILLVTGLSGSGKSTLAISLASKYNAEVIELDIFETHHGYTDENLKQAGDVFVQYLLNNERGKKFREATKYKKMDGKLFNEELDAFISFVFSYCKKNSDKKYIIEGVQIYSHMESDEVKNYPLVIKGTSMKNSVIRRLKRDNNTEYEMYLRNIPRLLKWYWGEEKDLTQFKKSMNESDKSYNPYITKEEAIAQGGYYDMNNIWNSILAFPDDPKRLYRGRVETLIMNDNMIFLDLKPNGSYRIPGGSFERTVSNLEQAVNETKEEARILTTDMTYSGVAYREAFSSPPKWALEQNMPVLWSGKYTEVYVANFDKNYKGYVNELDRDDDIYLNGSFYPLNEVYDKLKQHHKDALKSYQILKEEANDAYVGEDPTPNLTEEMYSNAKQWSDENNFMIITQRYDLDDLDRQYQAFLSMVEFARETSNRKSVEIFGINNITHYKWLRHRLLQKDTTDVNLSTIVSDDKLDSHSSMDDYVQESTKGLMKAVMEATSLNVKKELLQELEDKEKASFSEEVITTQFISQQVEKMENPAEIYELPEIVPFFTPDDMDTLGVFDTDPEGNFYNVESSKESYNWFQIYKTTGNPGSDWLQLAQECYSKYKSNPCDVTKQSLLELGWNPEIPLTYSSVRKRSSVIRESLSSYLVDLHDISNINEISDYTEIPYIHKNIEQYGLSNYLSESVDINDTNGRLFVNESGEYICHISIYEDKIVGKGYAPGKKELLSQIN